MTLATIMRPPVPAVGPDDSLSKIQKLLRDKGVHHLIVLDQGKLIGVISDRDVLAAISPFLATPSERPQDEATLRKKAHHIMTRKPTTVTLDIAPEKAAKLMLDNGISCLPVVDSEGAVIGIVTVRVLLRYIIDSRPSRK